MRRVTVKMNVARLWLIPAMATGLAAQTAVPASAEQRCYTDRGKEICFPLGAVSFADAVIALEMGQPKAEFSGAMIAEAALGEPDNDPTLETETDIPQRYVTIGCRGTLTLRFLDNVLQDVSGSDLYVFEIGDHVEPTRLAISGDNINWTEIGDIRGGLAAVDIGPFVQPGAVFRYVRLTDLGKRCDSRWPGADIDAVGAIGASPEANPDAIAAVNGSAGSGDRLPELVSVEIVDPDSLDPINEIAVGGRFRVRLTYAGDPVAAIIETVTIGTGRQGSLDVEVTGDTRVIVSDPIAVSPVEQ